MLGIAAAVTGSGRALPPVLAPSASVPALPALSLHEPLADGSVMRASTCTPRPPGVVTMFQPRPIVPSGFGVPSPTIGARRAAPH